MMKSPENDRLRGLLVSAYDGKDFVQAEKLCRQLKESGDLSVDLDYSLGLILHQTGRSAEG